MANLRGRPAPSTVIGYVETPAGRVAFADVVDSGGVVHYRTAAGQSIRRSVALASPHWTAATWPRWMPRKFNGGLPQRLPGWMTRGLPRKRTP